ncbi:MAG: lysylphosphatidylglycerol synthase transmembrane domain-containing protein [Chloroflexota bacterium]|nr:lysylphosphatidylglycerol synthase transmembrane domain-containing protein [Chloroflexota bacterium]
MKKHWMNVLRVLVSAGALVFLFWRIGLGETLDVLRRADLRYLLAAFLLFVFSLGIRAYRWFVLLRGLDSTIPFGRLLRLYFVGQFFSSFLPSQFGGDVVRALELTQDTDSPAPIKRISVAASASIKKVSVAASAPIKRISVAASAPIKRISVAASAPIKRISVAASASIGTVLLDRMTGLLVLFMMGLVVLPFNAARMEPWLVWLLLGVAGGGLVAGGLVLEGKLLRRLTRWLPPALSLAGSGPLAQVYAAVTGCGRRAVLNAFSVSVVFNLVNVLINWLCGRAVGAGVGLSYFFVATPLLAVSGLIPSIGGWGVREAVSTAIFTPAGAGGNVAAALGMALGGVTLAAGLVGGVIYGIEGLRGLRERA